MFSVIRSGHGDNPDLHQFLAAFRQIVVDKLLLLSEASSCQTYIYIQGSARAHLFLTNVLIISE